jgi:two-component system OmpR family sensor kinase
VIAAWEVREVGGAFLVGGAIAIATGLLVGYWLVTRFERTHARQRQFVSDASHELRTPLTAIRGQVEVLARERRPDAAEVRRVGGVVLDEVARIERLVGDLLEFSKLEEEAAPRLEEVDVDRFLRRRAEEAPGDSVALGELAGGTVRADPERLTQVVRNLLDNAIRHAGAEGRVELSAAAEGDRLTIRVDDDGPGITPEERERVFDRFHRSESARDRDSGGSGLGLAICRAIVELHGGTIWAEESPLGGARVAFEVPGFEGAKGWAGG